jgi:drug/metabolite transporter (DMT)-like permease
VTKDGGDASAIDYRSGCLYALTTAVLLATQGPLSALAAKHLTPSAFICITQVSLLLSVPLLTAHGQSRRDFFALLTRKENLGRLAILALIGLIGLILYNVGLKRAHPIIIAAIMNLSPFWAALVAKVVTRTALPVSPLLYAACFAVAFIGAMMVAWSQTDWKTSPLGSLLGSGAWLYAVPIPIFYALSGTLVGKWLSSFDDAAAIAANFIFSAVLFIPPTFALAFWSASDADQSKTTTAVLLLLVGTLAAAAIGRVTYQISLRRTNNDNGFVTMFFLLVPGLSGLISLPLSWFIPDLAFTADILFFAGLLLVTAALAVFSLRSWRRISQAP